MALRDLVLERDAPGSLRFQGFTGEGRGRETLAMLRFSMLRGEGAPARLWHPHHWPWGSTKKYGERYATKFSCRSPTSWRARSPPAGKGIFHYWFAS